MKKLLILCCLLTACTSSKPCYYISMPYDVETAILNHFAFHRELIEKCPGMDSCSEDEIRILAQKYDQSLTTVLSQNIQMLPY